MNPRLLFLFCCALPAAEEAGRIMRPVDKSTLPRGSVEVIATAPEGALELDGRRIGAEQPFPNVLQAKIDVSPGTHTLALIWPDGRKTIQFHAGENPPPGFEVYRTHPPGAGAACTQCHEISRRGRFVFKGGCFDCHASAGFPRTHTHTAEILAECGLCHNAHGSTAKSHLLHAKEIACRQCHN